VSEETGPEQDDSYLTVHEAAKKMERSTEQVRRYLREGKLAGRRVGGQWFIREAAVEYKTRTGGAAVAPGEFSYLDRPYSAVAQRRLSVLARINRRREAIGERWEREGLGADAAELVRELRDEAP
jgi:excisionase family DNA binding protein